MKLPPMLFHIRIRPSGRKGFGIWLPMFLLWPLLVPLMAAVIVLALVADFASVFRFRLTMMSVAVWVLICEMRGVRVAVEGKRSGTDVKISIV
jgi:hypothetical protein